MWQGLEGLGDGRRKGVLGFIRRRGIGAKALQHVPALVVAGGVVFDVDSDGVAGAGRVDRRAVGEEVRRGGRGGGGQGRDRRHRAWGGRGPGGKEELNVGDVGMGVVGRVDEDGKGEPLRASGVEELVVEHSRGLVGVGELRLQQREGGEHAVKSGDRRVPRNRGLRGQGGSLPHLMDAEGPGGGVDAAGYEVPEMSLGAPAGAAMSAGRLRSDCLRANAGERDQAEGNLRAGVSYRQSGHRPGANRSSVRRAKVLDGDSAKEIDRWRAWSHPAVGDRLPSKPRKPARPEAPTGGPRPILSQPSRAGSLLVNFVMVALRQKLNRPRQADRRLGQSNALKRLFDRPGLSTFWRNDNTP